MRYYDVLEKCFKLSEQLERERQEAFSREFLQTLYWSHCISTERRRNYRLRKKMRLLRQQYLSHLTLPRQTNVLTVGEY